MTGGFRADSDNGLFIYVFTVSGSRKRYRPFKKHREELESCDGDRDRRVSQFKSNSILFWTRAATEMDEWIAGHKHVPQKKVERLYKKKDKEKNRGSGTNKIISIFYIKKRNQV